MTIVSNVLILRHIVPYLSVSHAISLFWKLNAFWTH